MVNDELRIRVSRRAQTDIRRIYVYTAHHPAHFLIRHENDRQEHHLLTVVHVGVVPYEQPRLLPQLRHL